MSNSNAPDNMQSVRLDRWLCAARFFKTRALAKQAIDGGKVHLNGQRSKPGRMLCGDEMLQISKGFDRQIVKVIGLAEKRGSAKVARTLYEETKDSIAEREKASELRRIHHMSVITPNQKPDKRQRRKIHRFKQSQGQ